MAFANLALPFCVDHRSVTSANNRSTRFSPLPLVGVKWTRYRGWRANHARTLLTLCVP